MTTEKSITSTISRRLTAAGIWHVKLHGGPWQRAGIPDLLAIVGGLAVFLEVKRPGEGPTRLQERRIEEIRVAGAVAEVVASWEDVEPVLRSVRAGGQEQQR